MLAQFGQPNAASGSADSHESYNGHHQEAASSSSKHSSAEADAHSSLSSQQSIESAMSKLDPLAMLREIYQDQGSKTVAMISPNEANGDQGNLRAE